MSARFSRRTGFTLLIAVALAGSAGCFHSADVSKIVCNETKFCPSGYVCSVQTGSGTGQCVRPADGSAGEALAFSDGPVALDSGVALDSAQAEAGAVLLDGATDRGGGVDQAPPGNTDVALPNPDTYVSVDVALPDAPPDLPLPLPDVAVADAPLDLPTPDAAGKASGAPCLTGTECGSAYCVDGVCCNVACAGQCQACAEPNKVGTCSTISGAPRGTRAACAATSATCAGQCGGTVANQCTYPAGETVCVAASCSTDLAMKTASVCSGAGACTASSVVTCAAGKYCTGGACVNQIANGTACANSNQCSSANCSNSLCCPSAQTGCGSSCVTLSSNSSNCGSCGRACAAGSTCSGGSCYLVDGQACTAGADCFSGICSTFYLDSDGDHYGVGTGIKQCGTTPPTGYASQAGDCCDSDANAYPGQTATFTAADACGSFDYNCDGNETPKSNGPTNCGTPLCAFVSGVCTYQGGCTCSNIASDPCGYYETWPCGAWYGFATKFCGDPGDGTCVARGFGSAPDYAQQACN